MAELKHIKLYYSNFEALGLLGDAERGRLLTSLMQYAMTGVAQELSGNEKYLYVAIRAQIDSDNKAYSEKCRKNAENVSKRYGRIRSYTNVNERIPETTTVDLKKEEKPPFLPPSSFSPTPPISSPPYNPPKEERKEPPLPPLDDFSPTMRETICNWVAYKAERREHYKPRGLAGLVTQFRKSVAKYGEAAVTDIVEASMASNYAGIMWDRLKKMPDAKGDTDGRASTSSFRPSEGFRKADSG